ncbi:MAG: phenylalanine--tRNA ligase subunit alpha [Acidimicrobiia bacterium]
MTDAASVAAQLNAAQDEIARAVASAPTLDALDDAEREAFGKKSVLSAVQESIKHLSAEDRPGVGQAVAAFRSIVTELIAERRSGLAVVEALARAERERLDLSLGGHARRIGVLHPLTQVRRELEDVFVALGYDISEGPEVETDWYNFEALNFPEAHPARQMQDTLYVALGQPEEVLMRTHTSPVQVREMMRREPPIYTVVPGRVFRNEALDARHSPIFHQLEGLAVDRGLTFGDLAGTIEAFTSAYFGGDVTARLTPSFFPFTEPSAEFALSCPFCSGGPCRVCSASGWIELGGCGMVDPNVLRAVGYDPEVVSGFAFGFGLERMVMLRYGVDQIRAFYDNDLRFLAQF